MAKFLAPNTTQNSEHFFTSSPCANNQFLISSVSILSCVIATSSTANQPNLGSRPANLTTRVKIRAAIWLREFSKSPLNLFSLSTF